MGKEPTEPDSSLGVTLSGTPGKGQHVTMATEKALQSIFRTIHPEMANALLSHCLKVLKPN